MNQQQELLVFSVGAGVGVAAVVATLKFLKGWSLKPLIAGALAPTVAAACYMHWWALLGAVGALGGWGGDQYPLARQLRNAHTLPAAPRRNAGATRTCGRCWGSPGVSCPFFLGETS
jgi:hypothetical protein